MNDDEEYNHDDDDDNTSFTAEELLETVLNLAEQTVSNQFDDDTRAALYAVLDATARAYGIEVHHEGDRLHPPQTYPFKITDVSKPTDSDE